MYSSENNLSNPPLPPFSKGGYLFSPFEKGGLRGIIFMPLCEPPAHDGSSENALVNPSPPLRKAQGRPDPPLEGEGNSLSLRERVRVRVGIFIALCQRWFMMDGLIYFTCFRTIS